MLTEYFLNDKKNLATHPPFILTELRSEAWMQRGGGKRSRFLNTRRFLPAVVAERSKVFKTQVWIPLGIFLTND